MKDAKKANATLVDALGSALRSGDHGLKAVPGLVKRVLADDAWRSFVTQRGELVEHDRFEDFVVTLPLKGLGASLELVRTLVKDDPEALDLFDRAVQQPTGANQYSQGLDNIPTLGHPSGTSREAGLRRLRKDRPDLHAEVLAGALSTHAAMVAAGFRRRTATIPMDTAENAARALRQNMDPQCLAEVARLIAEEGG